MRRVPRITVKCAACGKDKEIRESEYELRKSNHFCNSKCQGKWRASDLNPRRKNKTKICEQCGNKFDLREKRLPESQRFCSSRCYGDFNKANPGVLQPRNPPKKVEKVCKTCKKIFYVWPYRAKQASFCSKSCKHDYGRGEAKCLICGKLFTFQSCQKRQYCSNKCAKNKVINSSKGEKEVFRYVKSIDREAVSNRSVLCGEEWYKPDIITKDKVIEFYGDYWHCSPTMFKELDFNESIKMTAYEKREFDNMRETSLRQEGYDVMVIWEHEWKNNKELMKTKIDEFLGVEK